MQNSEFSGKDKQPKKYVAPVLKVYGGMAEMTSSGTKPGKENGMGNMS